MKLAVSDLPFAGFRIKELLKLPIEYGVEFFYEFGKMHLSLTVSSILLAAGSEKGNLQK